MRAGTTNSVSEWVSKRAPALEKLLSASAILVVNGDMACNRIIQHALSERCALLKVVPSAEDAEAIRLQTHFDIVLVNTQLSGLSGLNWVRHLRDHGVQTHVIYLSAVAETNSAIEALRNGAEDFLAEPFSESQITQSIHRCLYRQSMVIEQALLMARLTNNCFGANAIGDEKEVSEMTSSELSSNNKTSENPSPSCMGFPTDWAIADVERSHIEAVLKSVNHNKSAAARILGVSRKTLERKQHRWHRESNT